MKVQINGQHLRFRIDEGELARLLSEGLVQAHSQLVSDFGLVQRVRIVDSGAAAFSAGAGLWTLRVPRDELLAYAQRLPCREGLEYLFDINPSGPALQVDLEVDVRDSVRARGPRRRAERGGDSNRPSG